MSATAEVPEPIAAATEEQPGARVALAAAAASPSHAYLLAGPPGAGKRAAARALVSELLAEGAPDPDDARRRAAADPSPHPDLVWLRPPGAQHLVEEVRERVIAAAAYRPFEGDRRAFVIEDADAMAEESQNALLKTLEEPASYAHLILISAEPESLLETVRSRCIDVRFDRPPPELVERRLAEQPVGESDAERRAAARLSAGDEERARFLLSPKGRDLRGAVEALIGAAVRDDLGGAPWTALLAIAEAAGDEAAAAIRERAAALEEESAEQTPQAKRRRARDAEEAERRGARAARTAAVDLGLGLAAAWLRDLAAVGDGAADLVLASDRLAELERDGAAIDPRRARRGAELAMDTRRRLQVNVNETLALEALTYRLEFLLGN